ncbi:MAG: hypothetical protein EOO07_34045 [Chitinophagaceae bacterium]|nr:MAG: hypothetical protein EOO07_34045 [Chitinophagaceae bacterium]
MLMIKWSPYLVAIILCANTCVLAQQRSIRGLVTDEANHPLPLANIGIVSNSITTMSNRSGEFTLKIPLQFQNDSIRISLTGFHTRTFLQKDFHSDTFVNRIILVKSFTDLPEVVVTVPDARELIMEAVRKIPENMFNDTSTITSFYRELIKKGDKPMVVSEAAFELFNVSTLPNKKRQLKLLQKRQLQQKKQSLSL